MLTNRTVFMGHFRNRNTSNWWAVHNYYYKNKLLKKNIDFLIKLSYFGNPEGVPHASKSLVQ